MMGMLPRERERGLSRGHLKEKDVRLLTEMTHGEIFAPSPGRPFRGPLFASQHRARHVTNSDAQPWHKGHIPAESHQLKAALALAGSTSFVARRGRLSPFHRPRLPRKRENCCTWDVGRGTYVVRCTRERAGVARLLGWLGSNSIFCTLFFSFLPILTHLISPPFPFLSLCPRPFTAVAENSTTSA